MEVIEHEMEGRESFINEQIKQIKDLHKSYNT